MDVFEIRGYDTLTNPFCIAFTIDGKLVLVNTETQVLLDIVDFGINHPDDKILMKSIKLSYIKESKTLFQSIIVHFVTYVVDY